MDLSTGGNIDAIRQAIIDASPVPIGTVPIYQAIQHVKELDDLTPSRMLDMVEHQAQQGVDYMTIHAGVLREHLPLTREPHHRHRLARRLAHRPRGCSHHSKQNPLVHALRRTAARSCAQLRRDALASATACAPAASPTPPTRRSSPS